MTAQVQETLNTPPVVEKKDPQASFSEMRKLLDAERSEKAQLKQKLEEFERTSKQKQAASSDDEDSDEPYIDQKTLKKKLSKFEESLDQRIEQKAEVKARQLFEEHNRSTYLKQNADFEQTMQPEMIQKFADKHPGMAEAILRMPDGFERQRLVYEAIKSTGVNKPEEQKKTIQQTIDQNRKSPYYIPASAGTAPYNGVGDFSPAGQKNAYEKLKELKSKLRLG